MQYKVSKISGAPQFDSLPIVKITHYPLEKRDYKPYAQCILCAGQDALTLRMWAFEVSPPAASSLRCVLYLYPDAPEQALYVDIHPSGQVQAGLLKDGVPSGSELDGPELTARPLGGEDLQGVYWGSTITLPLDALTAFGGAVELEPGCKLRGNFYKLCTEPPYVHAGSCFPADFTGNPYTVDNMGTFQIVAY